MPHLLTERPQTDPSSSALDCRWPPLILCQGIRIPINCSVNPLQYVCVGVQRLPAFGWPGSADDQTGISLGVYWFREIKCILLSHGRASIYSVVP